MKKSIEMHNKYPFLKKYMEDLTPTERQAFRNKYLPYILAQLSPLKAAEIKCYLARKGAPDTVPYAQNHIPTTYLWALFFRAIQDKMDKVCFNIPISSKAELGFPRVMIGCEWNQYRAIGETQDRKRLHPLIELALFRVSNRRGRGAYLKNGQLFFWGTCAEDAAASQIVSDSSSIYIDQLKDLTFTFPFRPRTLQYIAPCDNCEKLFTSYKK